MEAMVHGTIDYDGVYGRPRAVLQKAKTRDELGMVNPISLTSLSLHLYKRRTKLTLNLFITLSPWPVSEELSFELA
jgi:hypothetical protein